MRKILSMFLLAAMIGLVCGKAHAADREEYSVGKLRLDGAINSSGVTVLMFDRDLNTLYARGTSVPNAASGYAKGCIFIKTDDTSGYKGLYENQGTTASCVFKRIGKHVQQVLGGTIAATGNTDAYIIVPETSVLTGITFSGSNGIAGSTTTYVDFQVTNLKQDGSGADTLLVTNGSQTSKPTGLNGIGTNTAIALPLTGTTTSLSVTEGDRLRLRAAVTGTLENTITFPTYMLEFGGD